jgi:hypothetical protein
MSFHISGADQTGADPGSLRPLYQSQYQLIGAPEYPFQSGAPELSYYRQDGSVYQHPLGEQPNIIQMNDEPLTVASQRSVPLAHYVMLENRLEVARQKNREYESTSTDLVFHRHSPVADFSFYKSRIKPTCFAKCPSSELTIRTSPLPSHHPHTLPTPARILNVISRRRSERMLDYFLLTIHRHLSHLYSINPICLRRFLSLESPIFHRQVR